MKKISLLLMMTLFCIGFVSAQRTVTGTITDDTGEPLIGATLQVKEFADVGAATDIEGMYSIDVPEGGTALVISYTGFADQEIVIGSSNVIDVTMATDAELLDEVVVTGVAGATSRSKLTISASKIDGRLLENVPNASAAGALQGKIAGVSVVQPSGLPGSSAVISIRGATSLLGNQNPLIIVDGVLLASSNLADINTEDIKSVEVLKGAAAASLYGSKAANGVVQIMTKRGSRSSKPVFTIREEIGATSILNGFEQGQKHNYLLDANGSFALSDPDDPASLIVDLPDGVTNPNASIIGNAFPATFDNFGEAFGTGFFNTLSGSMSGGFEGGNYYVSVQNQQNDGIVKIGEQGYERTVGKVNLDFDVTDRLKLSTSNSYSKSENVRPSLGSGGPLYSLVFTPPHFDLGGSTNEEDGSRYNWNPFADNAAGSWPTTETNAFYFMDNWKYLQTRERLITNINANYLVNDWLSLRFSYGLDNLNSFTNTFVDKTWLDNQNTSFINGNIASSQFNFKNETISFNTFTTHKVSDDLNVMTRIQLLQEFEDYNQLSLAGSELVNTGVNNFENVSQENLNVGSFRSQEIAKSYSGLVSLDYKDRYLLDALARFEQVSSYGPLARDQWFYRVSGAYRLGMDLDQDWMDELKIRASLGTSGLRPPFAAQFEVVDVVNGNNTKNTIGNSELGPSISTEFEVGLEFNFLKKFRTSFTYSNTQNEDLIIPVPLAAAAGFSQQWQNAGSIEAKVFEATLGFDLIKKSNLSWNANVLFTNATSKITKFDRSELQVGPSSAFILRSGEIYGTFYGKSFLTSLDQLPASENQEDYTIYKGIVVSNDGTNSPVKLKDENGTDQVVAIGNTTPDFNLSFNTSLSAGDFTLFALLDWRQGGKVYNQTKQWRFRELLHPEIDGEKVGWASGLYSINEVNDFFVEDGSFLKLRELSLSYNLNKAFSNIDFLNGGSIAVVGRNLFVLTGYSGIDPEVTNIDTGSDGNYNDTGTFAFDAFGYPSTRTISAVLTLKF